jgi:hypothetical protein
VLGPAGSAHWCLVRSGPPVQCESVSLSLIQSPELQGFLELQEGAHGYSCVWMDV